MSVESIRQNGDRRSSPSVKQTVRAAAALVSIFTGFYVYHFGLTLSLYPSFLGGYQIFISIILLPLMLGVFIGDLIKKYSKWNSADSLFLTFCWYFALIAGWHYIYDVRRDVAGPHLAVIIQFITIYLVFRSINLLNAISSKAIFFSLLLMTFIKIYDYLFNGNILGNPDPRFSDPNEADYQGYAFVYFVLLLAGAGIETRTAYRVFYYVIGVAILFLIGARSEFFIVLIGLIANETTWVQRKNLIWVWALIACMFIAYIQFGAIEALLPQGRVSGLLLDFNGDGSLIERQVALNRGYETVLENPIFGNYASYPLGQYAHNIVSVWVDLGFTGFVIYCLLLFLPIVFIVRHWNNKKFIDQYAVLLSLSICALILFITTKSFTYQLIAVSFGLYGRCVDNLDQHRFSAIRMMKKDLGVRRVIY